MPYEESRNHAIQESVHRVSLARPSLSVGENHADHTLLGARDERCSYSFEDIACNVEVQCDNAARILEMTSSLLQQMIERVAACIVPLVSSGPNT
jgi:hypothetical protein